MIGEPFQPARDHSGFGGLLKEHMEKLLSPEENSPKKGEVKLSRKSWVTFGGASVNVALLLEACFP